jgi:hypothetical protein
MKKNIEWNENKEQFASGDNGTRNGVMLFSTHYDACRSKSDNAPPWLLGCKLPGIKSNLGNFADREKAKEKAEEVFIYWVKKLNLTIP